MSFFSFMKYYFAFLFVLNAQGKSSKEEFKLRPTLNGEQQGWFNAEGLPTSIKINDEWVLPRGGTMEWLMTKGYVPDDQKNNIMKPNPFDNRYRKPRRKIAPSLANTPVDYIAQPRVKKTNDPFAGLSDPLKRKYTPLPGVGASKGKTEGSPLGPILEPALPTLKDSPFDAPKPNPRDLPIGPLPKNVLTNQKPVDALPSLDPFIDDPLNQSNPQLNLDQLPGKKVQVPNLSTPRR